MSSHHEPRLRLDLPEHVLSFADVRGLVFGDHTCGGREEGGPDARGSSQCRGSPQHSLAPLRSGGRAGVAETDRAYGGPWKGGEAPDSASVAWGEFINTRTS